MGDDIREIEIQNRALQILNTNQLSLITELDALLVSPIFAFCTSVQSIFFIECYFYTQAMFR